MDHEFELAFNLLDEAAGRIEQQHYGITAILFHNHGDILLTTVHDYARDTGHHLVLLAADDHGPIAAIEATAPDLEAEPLTRILKVRAGELIFHGRPDDIWSYRAVAAGHTYTLTAGIGDQPMWTVTVDHGEPLTHDDLDEALSAVLGHHGTPIA
jgi:hypothetical protein